MEILQIFGTPIFIQRTCVTHWDHLSLRYQYLCWQNLDGSTKVYFDSVALWNISFVFTFIFSSLWSRSFPRPQQALPLPWRTPSWCPCWCRCWCRCLNVVEVGHMVGEVGLRGMGGVVQDLGHHSHQVRAHTCLPAGQACPRSPSSSGCRVSPERKYPWTRHIFALLFSESSTWVSFPASDWNIWWVSKVRKGWVWCLLPCKTFWFSEERRLAILLNVKY